MRSLLAGRGFAKTAIHRRGRLFPDPAINALHDAVETLTGALPRPLRRPLSERLFQSVTLSAWK
jgi:hypothetical protein